MQKWFRRIIFLIIMLWASTLFTVAQYIPYEILYATRTSSQAYTVYMANAERGEITEIATLTGTTADAGWSPDGRFIYLVSMSPDNERTLTLIDLNDDSRRVVTGQLMPDSCSPSLWWSPNGRFLTLLVGEPDNPEIMLLDTRDNSSEILPGAANTPVLWSPDSRYLAHVSGETGLLHIQDVQSRQNAARLNAIIGKGFRWLSEERFVYFAADVDGGIVVFHLQYGTEVRDPGDTVKSASPDGRYMVIQRNAPQSDEDAYFLVDTFERSSVQVYGRLYAFDYLWSPDSRYLLYGVYSEQPDAVILNVTDNTYLILPEMPFYPYQARWSPDGHTVAFMEDFSQGETPNRFWIYDRDSDTSHQFDMPLRYVQTESTLQWLPDGNRLLVRTQAGASLFDRRIGVLTPLDDALATGYAMHLSPDGRYLSFLQYEGEQRSISVLAMQDGTTQTLSPDLDTNIILIGWRGGRNTSLIYCGMG